MFMNVILVSLFQNLNEYFITQFEIVSELPLWYQMNLSELINF